MDVIHSSGSQDNRTRLLAGEVNLAPMQATAIGGELCVVAPLHDEVVHVLAREGSLIQSFQDLPGHRVAVGPRGSGSRMTAELIFESLSESEDPVLREVIAWDDLNEAEAIDGAVICIGLGSQLVSDLLASGRWKLVPIPSPTGITDQHPILRPATIKPDAYAGVSLPPQGIATVRTLAYLAAVQDTPSELVTAVLQVLYQDPQLCDGLIPRKKAAEMQSYLNVHDAARDYYSQFSEQ